MSGLDDLKFSAEQFSGIAPLFPLPNLVLFPHVVQALHVFESRYREMIEEVLKGDRLLCLGLLSRGWQQDYEGRPPVESTVCLGRLISHHRREDGTYNVLMVGLSRARIVEELAPSRSYRQVRLRLMDDQSLSDDEEISQRCERLQRDLMERFQQHLPASKASFQQLENLLGNHISLGMLTDLVGYSLDASVWTKQTLLCELDACRRAELLLNYLRRQTGDGETAESNDFPPRFSIN
ncbi:MAG: LON peptidase substrate-binding domain-containing protein [Pirellulaceae bacterium]|nr:LON peptidase substrate-binding domain-containing protein [Planctomycetales bacterium]